MKIWIILLIALGLNAFGQTGAPPAPTLAPELAPIAAKHKADLATVEGEKKTALARARQGYLAALDFADKSATSAGDLKGVVAVEKERDLAKVRPDLALSFPADLPESVRPARKVYLDAIGSANADAQKREQQIDSDYLRTLGMLDSHAATNPALASQIAAEKAEIIRRATAATSAAAPTTNASPAPATGGKPVATPESVLSEKLVNGNFEEVDADGLPTGWKLSGGLAKDGILPDGVSIKAVKENGVSFLRMTFDGRFHDCRVVQDVAVPNRARTATYKVWYRGKVTGRLNPTDRRAWPYWQLRFLNEKGTEVGGTGSWMENMMTQISFKTLEKTIPILDGAVAAQFQLGSSNCNGVFDFEHAEVRFK